MAAQIIRPIIKWAGGKSQLLPQIIARLPTYINKEDFCLVEPFVGGGALSFWALANLPHLKKLIINDYNADLINLYNVIQKSPDKLIAILGQIQAEYDLLTTLDDKKPYYYDKRALYNKRNDHEYKLDNINKAALFIFLNKAGFNGLYRVNKNNEFNVPIGSYQSPKFLDNDNILLLSSYLQGVDILTGDFEQTLDFIPKDLPCIFYLDPPYRPISDTASFTAYANYDFNDKEQIRLAKFCQKIHQLDHCFLLSNSDPKNHSNDDFFDELYADFQIDRVQANRAISANSKGRKAVYELLIYSKRQKERSMLHCQANFDKLINTLKTKRYYSI